MGQVNLRPFFATAPKADCCEKMKAGADPHEAGIALRFTPCLMTQNCCAADRVEATASPGAGG